MANHHTPRRTAFTIFYIPYKIFFYWNGPNMSITLELRLHGWMAWMDGMELPWKEGVSPANHLQTSVNGYVW